MRFPSMSFHPLINDFITLFDGLSSKASRDIALKWLTVQPSYSKDMWLDSNETGATPLMALMKVDSEKALAFLPVLVQEMGERADEKFFNQSDNDGATLLSLAWAAAETDHNRYATGGYSYPRSSSTDHDHFKHWHSLRLIQKNTAKEKWTFLDKKDALPGSGWASRLFVMASTSQDQLDILKDLNELSPPPLNPLSWFSATTEGKIQQLKDRGESITGNIDLGEVSLPAWQIIVGNPPYDLQILTQQIASGNFDSVSSEDVKDFLAPNRAMHSFVPANHRASTGYVKMVLASRRHDSLGRNAIDYLIEHRPDLLETLCLFIKNIPPESSQHFSLPDKAGWNLGRRAAIKLGRDAFLSLKRACQSSGISFTTDCGPEGFLVTHMPWALALEGTTKKGYEWPSICKRLRDNLALPEIFGAPKQQQKWVEWFDERWHHVIALGNSGKSLSASSVVKDMGIYSSFISPVADSNTPDSIIPELADRLRFMQLCVRKLSTSSDIKDAWRHAHISPPGLLESYALQQKSADFVPEHLSLSLCEVLESPLFHKKEYSASEKNNALKERYKATAQRFRLTAVAEKKLSDKDAPVKTRKI